jgi:ABC-type molybdate transport system ATPase subunit
LRVGRKLAQLVVADAQPQVVARLRHDAVAAKARVEARDEVRVVAFAQWKASVVHLLDAVRGAEAQAALEVRLDDVLRVFDRALRARVARLVDDELALETAQQVADRVRGVRAARVHHQHLRHAVERPAVALSDQANIRNSKRFFWLSPFAEM